MTRNKPHTPVEPDGFQACPASVPSDLRIMIIGDSISHGGEGDWTWRYRFWQWFKDQKIKVTFVGPHIGVQPSAKAKPPMPARVPGDPEPPEEDQFSGGYAKDCDKAFDSHHYAASGRQVAQAKGFVEEAVREYKPNMLVVFLGVNDMVWWASDADGTLRSMKEFVDNARAADPNMMFAIGDVPVLHAFQDGRQDLKENIPKYNKLLKEALPGWSTKHSPVAYVDVASHYICKPRDPNGGDMDGLHPGTRGDFQIARAYSLGLHQFYKIGSKPFNIPEKIPLRDLSIPKNFKAAGAPMGVLVTWDPVYGGHYEVADRIKGNEKWGSTKTEAPRVDTTWTGANVTWEYKIRCYYGWDDGEWSDVISAVSKKETAPPPKITTVIATTTGFDIGWERPKGDWNVSQYEVLWFDNDRDGSFPGAVGTRGTSTSITNLEIGHRFSPIMTTWTDAEGGSPWGCGRPVIVGAGDPSRPSGLKVKYKSFSAVHLTWDAAVNAAGYLVYKRNLKKHGSLPETDGDVVRETEREVGSLTNPWELEFSVVAVNGTTESAKSATELPKRHH